MYTTVNEDGILNNYAPQVAIYTAEYPGRMGAAPLRSTRCVRYCVRWLNDCDCVFR
jgi:hypothetical protein